MTATETPSLLMTRPSARAERFAEEVRVALGRPLRVVVSPLSEIRCRAVPGDLSAWGAVLLTSQSAVACLPAGAGAGRRAFCVGARTAAAARGAGFEAVSAGGDAAALVELVRRLAPSGRLLHLRGAEVAGDVAGALRAAGHAVEERVVYAQEAVAPTAEARALLAGPGAVVAPVFSPRGAARLAEVAGAARAALHVVAISAAAAAAYAGPSARLSVADRPDGDAMCAAVLAALRPAPC